MLTISKKRSLRDLACSFALGGAYVLWHAAPQYYNGAAIVATAAIGVFSVFEIGGGVRSPGSLGLRRDNLAASFRISCITLLPLLVGCLLYAAVGGIYLPSHFFVALLIYPVWGLLQQVFFQGIILQAFRELGLGRWSILFASVAFAMTHYPSRFLMEATAVGGVLLSLTYYLKPNVIPLALYHGIFGAFLYYVFRQKDALGFLFD